MNEVFGTRFSSVSSLHSYGGEAYDEVKASNPNQNDGEFSADDKNSTSNTSAKIYWVYLRAGAGIILLPILILSNILCQVVYTGSDYWLSQWTNYHQNLDIQSDDGNYTFEKSWMITEDRNTNIIIYTSLVVVLFIFCIARTVTFFTTCMRASVNLHNRLLKAVIRAPVSFFDKYPIGMILNRVSRDLGKGSKLFQKILFLLIICF